MLQFLLVLKMSTVWYISHIKVQLQLHKNWRGSLRLRLNTKRQDDEVSGTGTVHIYNTIFTFIAFSFHTMLRLEEYLMPEKKNWITGIRIL
jgi:hypothetical protein